MPFLALALVALLFALPAPAGAADRPCAAMVEVVDRSASTVLFWGRRREGEHRALCARHRGGRAFLVEKLSIGRPSERPRLGGRFLFYVLHDYDRGTGDSYSYAFLVDLARRRGVARWEFYALADHDPQRPPITFYRARVLASGSVGFSVGHVSAYGHPSSYQSEIHRRTLRGGRDVLAEGPEVDADSLRFSPGRMSWLDGGVRASAAFR